MAQKTITLNPGESKIVEFPFTPKEAKTYQVSVNGLTGSFRAISAVPVNKIVDFPDLQVLNVEGITFNKVAIETASNIDALVVVLKAYSVPPETPWVEQPEGIMTEHLRDAAQFILSTVLSTPLDATYSAQIAHIMPAVVAIPSDWLYPFSCTINPYTGQTWWVSQSYAVASYIAQNLTSIIGEPILTAYLSTPIVMSELRGITLTIMGKDSLAPYVSRNPVAQVNMWYEPAFSAPMPPPSYRGGGPLQIGKATEIHAKGTIAPGYYYPGIYNARIGIWWEAYPYSGGVNYFRIKNLAKVTGEGTV